MELYYFDHKSKNYSTIHAFNVMAKIFVDTMHERNMLMEKAYPRLKAFCQERGYEFQVVDMRWGVREEAADDHMATALCLRELEMCKKLSTGPNFVVLYQLRTDKLNRYIAIVCSLIGFVCVPVCYNVPSLQSDSKQLLCLYYRSEDDCHPFSFLFR